MTEITTTDHRIELPDGRTVAASDTGDAGGPVVVLCHPAPGSRRLDPDPAATAAADVRLVGVDRPGYGGSTPLAAGVAPTIPAFADDVVAVLDHLGVAEAALAGWSAGGRVALAAAARHPDRVSAVAVVATPAPQEAVPWIPEEHLALLDRLAADPGGATAVLTQVFAGTATAGAAEQVAQVGAGPADEAVLAADPACRDRLASMMAEAFVQGAVGLAADVASYTVVPWGFDPAAVGVPTTAFYGEGDVIVTPAHGEWYTSRVPGARLVTVPGVGHLVAVTNWADVLAAVG